VEEVKVNRINSLKESQLQSARRRWDRESDEASLSHERRVQSSGVCTGLEEDLEQTTSTILKKTTLHRHTLPFKSLGSSRQFCVFHENSLLFIK